MPESIDSTSPPANRKPGRELIVLGGIVGAIGVLIAIYLLTLGRPPLAGERSHDFGMVLIEGNSSTVEHTFTLTNRTSRTLQLTQPISSCGCTVSALSTNTLEPGEKVGVTARLTLSRTGRRSSEISIPVEGRGVHTLRVSGVGRMENEIHARRDHVLLRPDHEAILGFSVDAWPDVWDDVADLPPPTITAPDSVSTELVTWRMMQEADQDSPARWQARVALTWQGDDLPDDAQLFIMMREGQELSIPLTAMPASEQVAADAPDEAFGHD